VIGGDLGAEARDVRVQRRLVEDDGQPPWHL
jgi:hypothetical protein